MTFSPIRWRSASRTLALVAILAVLLALSSAQDALAATELAYDDGSAEDWRAPPPLSYYGVLFSTGCDGATLLSVRLFVSTAELSCELSVSVFKGDATVLWTTIVSLPRDLAPQWYMVTFSPGVSVPADFYVGYAANVQAVGVDTDSSMPERTYELREGEFNLIPGWHLMIRATVDRTCLVGSYAPPVGGLIEPANQLRVLTPYLALFGIVAAVAVTIEYERNKE